MVESSVCPSGAAATTRSVPMMEPAPLMFSTTTGCFHTWVSSLAIARASTSELPPAG